MTNQAIKPSSIKIGDILKVSSVICDTEYVKVWGVDESDPHPSGVNNWDYVVHTYDLKNGITLGQSFYLKAEEVIEVLRPTYNITLEKVE